MPIRDEDGHRAMQAAGKAWKAIKTSGAKTWREWTEVIGPGLVKARAEAQSISNASSGKGYNAAMGALLEEYGFGNALERHRSQVTRADLLHCMDYLTEIEKWRHDAKASVLLPVERHRKHRYPDHTVLNHPSVVWRRFKTSEDGKQAFKDRGIVPAKPRAPKPTADLKRDLDQAKARIEELKEELEAARFWPVTEAAAAPPRMTEADAQAYQQERFRLFRAQIEADLGITRAEIERIRGAYVALLPVDPEARRAELEALKRELHLDDLDPTPATKRRRTKKANPLSLQGRPPAEEAPRHERSPRCRMPRSGLQPTTRRETHEATRVWLAGQSAHRFEFTFTPKHGSWLNLVEGFFSKLARSVLRHIRVASTRELKDRLMAAVDYFNGDPVVHTWTYKLDKAA